MKMRFLVIFTQGLSRVPPEQTTSPVCPPAHRSLQAAPVCGCCFLSSALAFGGKGKLGVFDCGVWEGGSRERLAVGSLSGFLDAVSPGSLIDDVTCKLPVL